MSAKSIEAQLKKLGMKNDIAGLEACVRSVEDEKVILTSPVMSSVIHVLHHLNDVSRRKNSRRVKL
jgi:hypothetical protein